VTVNKVPSVFPDMVVPVEIRINEPEIVDGVYHKPTDPISTVI
jgi:hypothetical protein